MTRVCAALAVFFAAGFLATANEAPKDGTIRREGWSFDRSELNWYEPDPAKIAEQKAKGTLGNVAGWAEFDVEIPAAGWYELLQVGIDPAWPRNVYLDGELLFRYSHTPVQAARADSVKDGKDIFAKEANLWLTQGRHALRYERMSFPACLPARWLLRPAQGRPEASIRAVGLGSNVLRAGEPIRFDFLGGAAVPLAYELVLQDPRGEKLIPVGRVAFPANPGAKEPLKRTVSVTFPKEGQFQLLAKVGDKLLRPSDFKAPLFTVIDTKAPPAATELKTTPLIEIDCVAQTINGAAVEAGKNYFENRCRTAVVASPFGSYRESTPDPERVPPILVDGKEPTPAYLAEREKRHIHGYERWGCDSFAYKFDLPEANQLYRLQVDYPDDDRRTMGFHLQDFPQGNGGGWIQGGGVETGDHYPLSHGMKTHESYFFCRNPKGLVIPVVNLLPGWKAAAARIRIDRVEGGLPEADGEGVRGQGSGGRGQGAVQGGLRTPCTNSANLHGEQRVRSPRCTGVAEARFEGAGIDKARDKARDKVSQANAIRNPKSEIRNRTMGFYFEEPGRWDSYFGCDAALPTSFETMERWARWNRYLGANLLFPTVMCYNGITWPTKVWKHTGTVAGEDTPRMLALVAEKYGQRFVPELHVSVNILGLDPVKDKAAFDELVVRDLNGDTKCSWMENVFNALHPKVQDKYVELVGELADNLKDSPAFDGISIRLMLGWQWAGYNALPGLVFGYEDWTVAQFEKETGIQVPGKAGDPGRFKQRFDYLTGPKRQEWLDWRCGKVFALHHRILDRIRQAKPDARLYLNYFGPDGRCVLSRDKAEQMLEVGLDPRLYKTEPGIVIIPAGGMYGRRDSSPLMDAGKMEGLLYSHPDKPSEFWNGRAYSLYTDYFEYGNAAEFDRLGGKDVFINDCCVPTDIHEREAHAIALADGDSAFIINGGAGWMFGTPRLMQPFLREYRALPDMPFEPIVGVSDPVALWISDVECRMSDVDQNPKSEIRNQKFFYAVNRLPVKVSVAIKMKGWFNKVHAAADGAPIKLDGDMLRFELEPYMLKSFCAKGWGFSVEGCETKVPDAFVAKVKPIVEFCRQLSADLKAGRVAPELKQADADAAIAGLDAAVAAFGKGEYWKAWRVDSLPLVKLYTATDRFPPGMWERSKPHGLPSAATAPKLEPAGFLGDTRGRLSGCVGLDVAPDGALWIASPDKVMRFGTDGSYEKHLQLFRPQTPGTDLVFPAPLNSMVSLIALDKNRIGNREWPDPLWTFAAQSGRTHMPLIADGIPMKHPAVPLAVNGKGDVLVACNGENRGVYKYRADGTPAYDFPGHDTLYRLCDDGANGGAIHADGRIYLTPLAGGVKIFSPDGKELAQFAAERKFGVMALRADGQLLVAAEGAALQSFRRGADGAFAPAWQTKLSAVPTGVKFLAADRLAVGYNAPDPAGAVVREYQLAEAGAAAGTALAPGLTTVENACLSGYTQLKTRDNAVYYGAHKKIWRLASGVDRAEMVFDAKLGFESFAFAPNGDLYLAAHSGASRGINVYRARKTDAGYEKLEYLNGGKALFEAWYMVPTDMEVDGNGEVIVRLLNPEAKPEPAKTVSLFRWSPETGKRGLLRDVGLAAIGYGDYGLHRLPDGGLLIAGGTTRTIQRLAPDGKVLWNKTFDGHYLPGAFDTLQPLGVTADSQGRVWVTDTARRRIICLAADGGFLGAYGHFGTMDDRSGFGLNSPVGIAAAKDAAGNEYLYVADTGNQRIVKFLIK